MQNREEKWQKGCEKSLKRRVMRGGKISFSERGKGRNIVLDQNIDPCILPNVFSQISSIVCPFPGSITFYYIQRDCSIIFMFGSKGYGWVDHH
jgi:hypothetical protein